MAAQFGDIEIDAGPGKQRRDFEPSPPYESLIVVHRGAQNVPDLFLHAAAVVPCAALQPRLNPVFNIAYDKLCHVQLRQHDIMISIDLSS